VPDIAGFDRIIAEVAPSEYQTLGSYDRRRFTIDLNLNEDIFRELTIDEETSRRLFENAPEGILASVVLAHELTHWYQQIGTAYGYWELNCDLKTYEAISTFLRGYRKRFPRSKLPVPIFDWLEARFGVVREEFRAYVEAGGDVDSFDAARGGGTPLDHALSCFVLPRMVELCEGHAQSSELVAAGPLYGQSWAVLASGQLPNDLLRQHMKAQMVDQERSRKYLAAVPSVPGYGLFGAAELLEGQAHVLEALTLNQMQLQFAHESLGPTGQVVFGPRDGIPPIYTVAVLRFARALRRSELDKDDLNTFLAIVDFALATPLHPIFGYELKSSPEWRDLHPGWRFLRLCDVVAETKTMGNYAISLNTDVYLEFVEHISEHVGWPSPIALARRFVEHFPDRRATTWPEALFLTASALRLEHPTLFVHYLFDDAPRAELLRARLAQPVVRIGADSWRLAGWTDASEEQRRSVTSDWLRLSDGFHVADAVASGRVSFEELDLVAYKSAADVLKAHWGVTEDDFQQPPAR
jgi:hypothetical protein